MQGELTIECMIDRSGQVTATKVIASGAGLTAQGQAILGRAAMNNIREWRFQADSDVSPPGVARVLYKFRLEDKLSRRRTTRFEFEFPNVAFVTSQYMPLMP